jgi:hypothetical protein
MEKIQYPDILKRALVMTWNNKFLWFFGFLIFLGSLVSNIGANSDALSGKSSGQFSAADWIQSRPAVSLLIALVFIAVLLAVFLLRLAGTAAIIKAASNIAVYSQSSIKTIFSEAKGYVWQLLWLEVLVNVALGIVFVVLLAPVAYLLAIRVDRAAAIPFMVAVLVFFAALAVLAYYLRRYAYFHVILGNMKTRMALESAYGLFRKNIKKSVLMGLVTVGTDLAALAILAVFLVTLAAGILALGMALSVWVAKALAAAVMIAAAVVVAGFLLAMFSWYAAFKQTAWVLFFQEISLEKQMEKKLSEKLEAEAMPTPEAV